METLIEKLNRAQELKKQFKLREAAEYFNECAQMDPMCVIASAQAGLCHLLLGEPDVAEPFLDQAYRASHFIDVMVGAYLGATLTANDKEKEAEAVREKCLKIDPEVDIPEAYMVVAEMLSEKKRFDETLRIIDILSSVYADSNWLKIPRNHYRLIRVLANSGVLDIAEFLTQSLTENMPNSWESPAAQAAIAIAKKEYETAYNLTIDALNKGGSIDPLLDAQQHWLAINK